MEGLQEQFVGGPGVRGVDLDGLDELDAVDGQPGLGRVPAQFGKIVQQGPLFEDGVGAGLVGPDGKQDVTQGIEAADEPAAGTAAAEGETVEHPARGCQYPDPEIGLPKTSDLEYETFFRWRSCLFRSARRGYIPKVRVWMLLLFESRGYGWPL